MEGMGGSSENLVICGVSWDRCVRRRGQGKGTYVCGYVLGCCAVDADGRSGGGWWLGCLRA